MNFHNEFNESNFCKNIINKYKTLLSKKLSRSKSFSKIYENNLIIDNTKIINKKFKIPKKAIDKEKKILKFRNNSFGKNKSKLLCLKNPFKSNFVQNILNEIIPKNIRKPYGVKVGYNFPDIQTKTEANIKIKKNDNKIIIKKTNFLKPHIENVTKKYSKNFNNEIKLNKINICGKYFSNILSTFDFELTNNF